MVNLPLRKLEIGRHWSILPKQINSTLLSHLFCKTLNQQTISHSFLSSVPYCPAFRHFIHMWEALQSLLNTGRKKEVYSVLIACQKHMLSVSQRQDRSHVCRLEQRSSTWCSAQISHTGTQQDNNLIMANTH